MMRHKEYKWRNCYIIRNSVILRMGIQLIILYIDTSQRALCLYTYFFRCFNGLEDWDKKASKRALHTYFSRCSSGSEDWKSGCYPRSVSVHISSNSISHIMTLWNLNSVGWRRYQQRVFTRRSPNPLLYFWLLKIF